MNRKISITELSGALAQHAGTDKATASALLRNFFATIAGGLEKDSLVKVKGFATFKTLVVEERESVDVNTGERISIGSHAKISFTPDATLKALVNRPFSHFKTITLNDETSSEELEEVDRRMAEELEPVREAPKEEAPVSDETESREEDVKQEEDATAHAASAETSEELVEKMEEAAQADNAATSEEEEKTEDETSTPADDCSAEDETSENDKQTDEAAAESEEGTETDETETELPKNHKVLKWVGASLLAIILFAAGYFTGCFFPYSTQRDDSEKKPEKAAPAQSAPLPKAEPEPVLITPTDSVAPVGPAPAVPEMQSKPEPKEDKPQSAALPKHPVGNVSIVGTQGVHTLKIGEDLTHLALQYYGSKDYVRYIIQHNELENPNIVHVGTKLKMPKLKVE